MAVNLDFILNQECNGEISRVYSAPGFYDSHLNISLSGIQDGLNKNFTINGLSGIGYDPVLIKNNSLQVINEDYIWDGQSLITFNSALFSHDTLSIQIGKVLSNGSVWGIPISSSCYSLTSSIIVTIDMNLAVLEPGYQKLVIEYNNNDGLLVREIFNVPFYYKYLIQKDDMNELVDDINNNIRLITDIDGNWEINRNTSTDSINYIIRDYYEYDNTYLRDYIKINRDYQGLITEIEESTHTGGSGGEYLNPQDDSDKKTIIKRNSDGIVQEIRKYNSSSIIGNLNTISNFFNLETGSLFIMNFLNDNDYLYFVIRYRDSYNFKIKRLNLTTDVIEDVTYITGYIPLVWDKDNDYFYIFCNKDGENSQVLLRVKIDASETLEIGNIDSSYSLYNGCLKSIDNYLYIIYYKEIDNILVQFLGRMLKTDTSSLYDIIRFRYMDIPDYRNFNNHISYDNNYIYILEIYKDNSKIWKIDKSDLTFSSIVRDIYNPYFILINDNNIYLSEYNTCRILKCDKDGSNLSYIVGSGEYPNDLEYPSNIYIYNNKIFWTGKGIKSIENSNLDGSNRSILYSTNNPLDQLFVYNNKMYIVERNQYIIRIVY